MARVVLSEPYLSKVGTYRGAQGDRGVGLCYIFRRPGPGGTVRYFTAEKKNPRVKPFTVEEMARQEKFRTVAQQVRTELSDPVEKAKWEAQKGDKYATAFGAAFAFYYKQAGGGE